MLRGGGSPLLTGMSFSHRLRGKHEGAVMRSVVADPIYGTVHVVPFSAAWHAWTGKTKAEVMAVEQRSCSCGRLQLQFDLTVPKQCSRITLRYTRQRQHTLTHTHTGGGCHVNQWVRPFRCENGEGGIPFFLLLGDTLFNSSRLNVCQKLNSSNSDPSDAQTGCLESESRALISSDGYFEAPPSIHSCLLFVSLYLGAPEVSDGCVYTQRAACQWDIFGAQTGTDAGNKCAEGSCQICVFIPLNKSLSIHLEQLVWMNKISSGS